MGTKPNVFGRVLAVCGLFAGFMLTASIISPRAGRADEGKLLRLETALMGDTEVDPGKSVGHSELIGELVGGSYRVQIYAGYPEPVYTVMTLEGEILAERIAREEAMLRFQTIPMTAYGYDESGSEMIGLAYEEEMIEMPANDR